jgi:Holliday junction resolvase-like predicted endonuclease
MYCAATPDGSTQVFVRAKTRNEAVDKVLEALPREKVPKLLASASLMAD